MTTSMYATSQAAIQFAPTSKVGSIHSILDTGEETLTFVFYLKQQEYAKMASGGLHPAPRTCYKVFHSCRFIVCFYNRAKWILLPTFRERSQAGGALAETEPFSSLACAQVPSNNINSLCLLQPVHRHFLQSANVKIKQTQLRWLGHMAKTKCHQDSVNTHGLIPLYSITSLPPSFLHMYEYLAKNQGYQQT